MSKVYFCSFLLISYSIQTEKLRSILSGTNVKNEKHIVLDNKIARKYGWRPKTDFKDGFKITYLDFLRKFKNRQK